MIAAPRIPFLSPFACRECLRVLRLYQEVGKSQWQLLYASPSAFLLACSSSRLYQLLFDPSLVDPVLMEGVPLTPFSEPSPEEIEQQLATLQLQLETLEGSGSKYLAEIRGLTTAASVTQTQRRLILHMGEVNRCIERSQRHVSLRHL